MTGNLLIIAIILLVCVFSSKLSARIGLPTLLIFIGLGMVFGSDGIFNIQFEDYILAEQLCTIALIYIMFYGGFGTNWKMAKPVAVKATVLSTLGVVLTALLTGVFCFIVLKFSWLEGLLIGSVIASTDAASVFSILRIKKLNLVDGLASLLEIESGSNDPVSYMMTTILLSIMSAKNGTHLGVLIFSQIFFGIFFGFLIGMLAALLLRKFSFESNESHMILVVGIAMASYAIPTMLGGNGFLSVYITGIILGNSPINGKVELVHFFDGITGMMQILLFFILGLLSFPSQIPRILLIAVAIALFLTFVGRPLVVFLLMTPFRVPFKQQLLISWSGLRGAASIVFAILTVISPAYTKYDIFHIVFCIALLSVAIQGTLLPWVSKKLQLIEDGDEDNVFKTFNDYEEELDINLIKLLIGEDHPWIGQNLGEISLPPGMLAVMIQRGHTIVVPKGDTVIKQQDMVVLSCMKYQGNTKVQLEERIIDKKCPWLNHTLSEISLPDHVLVVMIKRGDQTLIPTGNTVIHRKDTLILCGTND